jgi:uncharacterized protein (TIGR02145 family)
MRTKILVLLVALLLSANLRAQVTIGELVEPTPGTLLDLNKAVKGGLVLSTVDLEDFNTIPTTFPGITATPSDAVKTGFTGALVYNTGMTSPPAGIYVWNGTNWTPVEENCTPRTTANLTLTGLPFAKTGSNVTFAVSSGASTFCAQGEKYEWSKTAANGSTFTIISGKETSSLTTSFSPAGTYKVKAKITNRYTEAPVEKIATIEITDDDVPPARLLDAKYAVTGDFCYDVKGPQGSQSNEYYASRVNAFESSFTKTYTFTYTDGFSDLTVVNPGGIVASVSQPTVTYPVSGTGSINFTITFVPEVQQRVIDAPGKLIEFQLIVIYKKNGSEDRVAYKNIKVQDATCGCPVAVPTTVRASGWLTFQCHNLGGVDITSDADLANITSQNFRTYHGDWYRWGSPNVSMANTVAHNDNDNWDDPDYQESSEDDTNQKDGDGYNLWKTENNPCPAGWRLPTLAEWQAVIGNNTIKKYVGASGAATQPSWTIDNNNPPTGNYNNVMKVGDHLYLPAAGFRVAGNGELYGRGYYGFYWSSSSSSLYAFVLNFYGSGHGIDNASRLSGLPVRCVSAD